MTSWRLKAALLWSLAGHLVLVGWATRHQRDEASRRAAAPSVVRRTVELEVRAADSTPPRDGPAATVRAAGDPIATVLGPGDHATRDPRSPSPLADVNTPDPLAAAHGGGGSGAPDRWTGRQDRWDLRTQIWNDPEEYRLPRERDDDERAAPHSIARIDDPALDASHHDRARLAQVGHDAPAPQPAGVEAGMAPPETAAVDGPLAAAGGEPRPDQDAREDRAGDVTTARTRATVKAGPAANESPVRDPIPADNADSAQASTEQDPGRIEFTRPGAGGVGGDGVADPVPGDGNSAAAKRAGAGQGGTPDEVAEGAGSPATRAREQIAYLKKLGKRVRDKTVFPQGRALGLEQGEVIVSFTLHLDGTVSDVRIARSSGYEEFDAAVLVAVKQASPFPPVPAALAGGRKAVPVNLPLLFDNPLIR